MATFKHYKKEKSITNCIAFVFISAKLLTNTTNTWGILEERVGEQIKISMYHLHHTLILLFFEFVMYMFVLTIDKSFTLFISYKEINTTKFQFPGYENFFLSTFP